MGSWQLEAGKFAFCVLFPVISFYYYHNALSSEDKILDYYEKHYTRREMESDEKIKEFTRRYNKVGMKRFEKLSQEYEEKPKK